MSRLSAISLYSGAGGLDLGFIEAGFEVLWANDADPFAVRTYHANIATHAVCGDVLEVVEGLHPRAFVLENVKSLGGEPLRAELRDRAEKLGSGWRASIARPLNRRPGRKRDLPLVHTPSGFRPASSLRFARRYPIRPDWSEWTQ